MKELDSFTVERLEGLIGDAETWSFVKVPARELKALARIALAAKRAEPVGYWNDACDLDYGAFSYANDAGCTRPLYTTPQLNSQVPLGSWIKCSDQMPTCSSEFLVYETMNNKVQHDYWVSDDDAALDRGFWNHYDTEVTHWMPLPAAPGKPL